MVDSPYATALDAFKVERREAMVLDCLTRYWTYSPSVQAAPAQQQTIVLVHGFRGDHHGLEPVLAALGGFRFVAADLPGFGESTPFATRHHDVDAYAAWLTALVGLVAPDGRALLLGHSFGSVIAAAALAGGLRVSGAVLVNPIGAPALGGPRRLLSRLALLYYRLGAALPERVGFALLRSRMVVRLLSIVMAKTRQPDLRRWIHDQHRRYFSAFADRRVVLQAFEASVSSDVSDFAAEIAIPVLLIGGERDDITPAYQQERLATLFADADLVMIDSVGHLVHYEAPDRAAQAVRDFLDRMRG